MGVGVVDVGTLELWGAPRTGQQAAHTRDDVGGLHRRNDHLHVVAATQHHEVELVRADEDHRHVCGKYGAQPRHHGAAGVVADEVHDHDRRTVRQRADVLDVLRLQHVQSRPAELQGEPDV